MPSNTSNSNAGLRSNLSVSTTSVLPEAHQGLHRPTPGVESHPRSSPTKQQLQLIGGISERVSRSGKKVSSTANISEEEAQLVLSESASLALRRIRDID